MAILLEVHERFLPVLFPELSAQEAKAVVMYAYYFQLSTIASEEGVSAHTVRTYLDRAKAKFDVSSLSELRVICLFRVGWLKIL